MTGITTQASTWTNALLCKVRKVVIPRRAYKMVSPVYASMEREDSIMPENPWYNPYVGTHHTPQYDLTRSDSPHYDARTSIVPGEIRGMCRVCEIPHIKCSRSDWHATDPNQSEESYQSQDQ